MRKAFFGNWVQGYWFALGLLATSQAEAHGVHTELGGFLNGVAHPLSGLDHVLMAVAAGLLWARLAPQGIMFGLMVFAACLGVGYSSAQMQVVLTLPEAVLAGSVLLLGLALSSRRVQPQLMLGFIALSALVHGLAHGLEAGQAWDLHYAAGFELASLGLFYAAALGHRLLVRQVQRQSWVNGFGALCTLLGLAWLGLG